MVVAFLMLSFEGFISADGFHHPHQQFAGACFGKFWALPNVLDAEV